MILEKIILYQYFKYFRTYIFYLFTYNFTNILQYFRGFVISRIVHLPMAEGARNPSFYVNGGLRYI